MLIGLIVISGSLATSTSGQLPELFSHLRPATKSHGLPEKQGILPAGDDYYAIASRDLPAKKYPPLDDPLATNVAKQIGPVFPHTAFSVWHPQGQIYRFSRRTTPFAPRSPPLEI